MDDDDEDNDEDGWDDDKDDEEAVVEFRCVEVDPVIISACVFSMLCSVWDNWGPPMCTLEERMLFMLQKVTAGKSRRMLTDCNKVTKENELE